MIPLLYCCPMDVQVSPSWGGESWSHRDRKALQTRLLAVAEPFTHLPRCFTLEKDKAFWTKLPTIASRAGLAYHASWYLSAEKEVSDSAVKENASLDTGF